MSGFFLSSVFVVDYMVSLAFVSDNTLDFKTWKVASKSGKINYGHLILGDDYALSLIAALKYLVIV